MTCSRRQYYGRYEPNCRVSIGKDRYLRQAVTVLNAFQIMKAKDKYCGSKP
jgi:hypothetical protein